MIMNSWKPKEHKIKYVKLQSIVNKKQEAKCRKFGKITTIHKSDLIFAGHYIQSTKMMFEIEKLKCAWDYKWKIATKNTRHMWASLKG